MFSVLQTIVAILTIISTINIQCKFIENKIESTIDPNRSIIKESNLSIQIDGRDRDNKDKLCEDCRANGDRIVPVNLLLETQINRGISDVDSTADIPTKENNGIDETAITRIEPSKKRSSTETVVVETQIQSNANLNNPVINNNRDDKGIGLQVEDVNNLSTTLFDDSLLLSSTASTLLTLFRLPLNSPISSQVNSEILRVHVNGIDKEHPNNDIVKKVVESEVKVRARKRISTTQEKLVENMNKPTNTKRDNNVATTTKRQHTNNQLSTTFYNNNHQSLIRSKSKRTLDLLQMKQSVKAIESTTIENTQRPLSSTTSSRILSSTLTFSDFYYNTPPTEISSSTTQRGNNKERTTNKSLLRPTRQYSSTDNGIPNVTVDSNNVNSTITPPLLLLTTNTISDNYSLLTTVSDYVSDSDNLVTKVIHQEIPWPVKKEAVVEGDLVLGGLMMVHEREDTITCGPVMPQGGIQALEAMLYTLDRLNFAPDPLLPNITLGAHILDDCDKDTYGLEMAVDFIKDENNFDINSYQQTSITDLTTNSIITSTIHHKLRHHHENQDIPWPVKKEAIVEGDLILGGLMMVHEREDTITCGPVMPQGGIQALEAMLYTLDRLNYDPNPLLPNISLGAHILDDCDKDTYGLEMAVDFIKGSISNIDGAEYHCNKTQVRKVISGVVGAASSVTSIQVANLLRLFKIPQVSFFSTSPELSNKQRFEFFTRTIPSDHYQVKAMVDIVRLMGWSYISIIYEESNYGIKAFEELEDLLAEHNICIAVKEKLVKDSGVADESAYDNIVQKLLTKPRARGCIIFGSDQEVAGVMRAVRRSNATGSFSWIGSDGWSARSLVSDGNEAEVEGTLSVQPQANPVQGFEEYFLSLNVENNRRNPWFVEFWEHHFQCRYPNSSKTPYNQKHAPQCTGKEKLTRNNTVFEDQLQFVSDAVMAFAYAFRDMHKDLCHGRPGLCDAMKPTKGAELLKYLRKVDFEGLSGDRFHFDSNGDGPARYNIIHFKQISVGKYRWVRVGEYVEGELRLNMSEIQFKLGHPKPPVSVCSFPCDLGQAKKYVEGESCCWHCFNCTQYQIRHPTDPTQCIPCPQGTVPDPHHVRCNDIPEEYLRPDSGWAIGAMAFSSTGILITMFVCGVFIRYNNTPVVRASGRELSYVLLAGILMCYSVTYALVLRPNDIVCGIQRFSAGFCFTVVYAALLTKTNRISRIFNASKHSAKRPSFISPRSQLIICSGLVGVQVLINAIWMMLSPARAIHHYPTREDNLLVCSSYIDASYMIAFTYPIFLIVVCTVYAVLTRKIPEAFNESKHIGFTMYTTCVIWLAFVPLYFGTANHVALRITSMSVTISLSASVTVACLFSPKLYIILIRPERNVRQSMMPMRYSAINKSSATTGSGSMMAAVMVTAATCDQKQQIEKHVPPIEEDDDLKVKPHMKDNSTQTTPNSSNNHLNSSSQEHLEKMNNNCNIGNGPIAIKTGVQFKDYPL